jgi:putative nucleotidyltransferase with HDIG domain
LGFVNALPFRVQVYIYVLIFCAFYFSSLSFYSLSFNSIIFLQISIFSLAIFVSDLFPIVLPGEGKAEVTISCAFKTAAAIVCGPKVAIIVTLLGTLMAEVVLQRTWYKALFNAAEMTLTTAAIAVVYEFMYDGSRMPFNSLQNGFAVLTMISTYVFVNVGLVAVVVSLATGTGFLRIWKANFRDSAMNNLTIIPLGAVTATLFMYRPWSVLVLALPMVVVQRSFQYIGELQRQTREALVHMADAIDHRDPSTFLHSQRVAQISEAVSEEMGLLPDAVETIRMAARLHDLGKIGMSNALLFKPGRFDEDEWVEFRKHPMIGAELIRSFRLFREGQTLILHHHERYDGAGYPMGLSGEEIPLGSRILTVADSFDAMLSRRVYRPPSTLDEAVTELITNKGSQFDPKAVEALIRLLEQGDPRVIPPADHDEPPSGHKANNDGDNLTTDFAESAS